MNAPLPKLCGGCMALECAECWPPTKDEEDRWFQYDERLDDLREFDRHPERYR